MGQFIGYLAFFFTNGWSSAIAICGVVLAIEAVVILATQRGTQRQRRWAALGPAAVAVLAGALANATWSFDRSVGFGYARLCAHVGDAWCAAAVVALGQQVDEQIEMLAWVVIAVTGVLALVTTWLVATRGKPVIGPEVREAR